MKTEKKIIIGKEKNMLTFTNEEGKKAYYDFKTKKYYIETKNKNKRKVKNLENYFRGYRAHHISNKNGYGKFIKYISMVSKRNKNIQRFIELMTTDFAHLEAIFTFPNLEILLEPEDDDYFGRNRHISYIENYDKNVLKFMVKYDIPLLPSYELSTLREPFLIELCKKGLQNDKWGHLIAPIFDKIMDKWVYKNFFRKTINDYNLNTLRVLEYLDYLKRYEAVEDIHAYTDYLHFSSEVKKKFNKYPRHLLTEHQIVSRLYSTRQKCYDDDKFKEISKKYAFLEYKDDNYTTIIPSSTKEIIDEGKELSHCVGSYCDEIIDEKTFIFFIRSVLEPSVPLLTLEIRGNNLVQASGLFNRPPKQREKKFIKKLCEKKNLINRI